MQSKDLHSLGLVAKASSKTERKNLASQRAAASRDGKKLKSTFEVEFIGSSSIAVGKEEMSLLSSANKFNSFPKNGSRVSQETIYGDLSVSYTGRRGKFAASENKLAALISCWVLVHSRIAKDSVVKHLLRDIGIQSKLSSYKGSDLNMSSSRAKMTSRSSKFGHLTCGSSMNSHPTHLHEAIAWRKHVLDRG